MSLVIICFILLSVLLSVAAQIFLKHGMSSERVLSALQTDPVSAVLAIALNPSVLLGLTAYVMSMAFWLLVLSKLDVSKAYPFVGLGFVLTMLFAYVFLNEPLTTLKVAGTLLVFAGVFLISQS